MAVELGRPFKVFRMHETTWTFVQAWMERRPQRPAAHCGPQIQTQRRQLWPTRYKLTPSSATLLVFACFFGSDSPACIFLGLNRSSAHILQNSRPFSLSIYINLSMVHFGVLELISDDSLHDAHCHLHSMTTGVHLASYTMCVDFCAYFDNPCSTKYQYRERVWGWMLRRQGGGGAELGRSPLQFGMA